ncbi:MAG: hypothetical protein N0A16_10285 [Blastocatellia bacterium]|nr:hypothetical protein [Blastocatellia bacterium]MCS7158103.1 hypothetical protein [Blastocatellia bacterium]MCX7753034.1 hypothetical protein [Blastocatellia bacterium]MDW8168557.1 hypothetical protein [Acidobacteriota bacterium]MDW8257280.1 hypothetical protein [Acidobacteriota bacterium]
MEERHEQETMATQDEEITYHAVEKDGEIAAIWVMKGRKHLRTIDPKSEEGRRILQAYRPSP